VTSSSGYASFIERTPEWTLNASVPRESIAVPEYQPFTERQPESKNNGKTACHCLALRFKTVARTLRILGISAFGAWIANDLWWNPGNY
jgi:hypothetical protein